MGPGLALAPHRNATATVVIALDAPFFLAVPAGKVAHKSCSIALIPPNTVHHLRTEGPMIFVYLDALGDDHRTLQQTDLDAARKRVLAAGTEALLWWNVDSLCEALGVLARKPPDPRITAAIHDLEERPQDFHRVADLAAVAGLSPSRFQALFVQAVGMPFRRYRLWRRMAVVMRSIGAGHSLTEAAHEAGFSGSAHLSSTFRAMFGLTPSGLLALGLQPPR